YAERRAEIVTAYEAELRREAFASGRIDIADTAAMRSMPPDVSSPAVLMCPFRIYQPCAMPCLFLLANQKYRTRIALTFL
ncbi:MAG: hypothetical protein IJO48_00210, partial [Clostridia bacterium]|nr:hypothetical protein [Clostridia bacterium]